MRKIPFLIFFTATLLSLSAISLNSNSIEIKPAIIKKVYPPFNLDNLKVTSYFSYLEMNEKWYWKIPERYRDFAAKNSYEAGQLPLWALYVMIEWESGWQPKAHHNNIDPVTGEIWSVDRGIGQICNAYQKGYVHDFYKGDPKKFDVWNWRDNLQTSIYHLANLRKTFDGNWYKAFEAYNGGIIMILKNTVKPEVKKYAIRLLKMANKTEYIPIEQKKKIKK